MSTQHATEFPGLSAAGEQRREAMLGVLRREVVRTHRRRVAVRLGSLSCVLLALTAAWLARGDRTPARPTEIAMDGAGPAAIVQQDPTAVDAHTHLEDPAPYAVRVVSTDAASVSALVVRTSGMVSSVRRIDDDELIRVLSAEGRSVGVVRTHGRVVVTENSEAPPVGPRGEIDGPATGGFARVMRG